MTNKAFVIHADTNYTLMNHLVSYIELMLNDRKTVNQNVESLDQIVMKLKSINGRISDPRGAFMQRTKVKDCLLRLSFSLTLMRKATSQLPQKQTRMIS